jgi:hypothetical protein
MAPCDESYWCGHAGIDEYPSPEHRNERIITDKYYGEANSY